MGVGKTGVGEMGQIIGKTGVGEMGVGETGTSRLYIQIILSLVGHLNSYILKESIWLGIFFLK